MCVCLCVCVWRTWDKFEWMFIPMEPVYREQRLRSERRRLLPSLEIQALVCVCVCAAVVSCCSDPEAKQPAEGISLISQMRQRACNCTISERDDRRAQRRASQQGSTRGRGGQRAGWRDHRAPSQLTLSAM